MMRRSPAAMAVAVLIGFFLPTSTASAHASLVSSFPVAGAVMMAAPAKIHLLFSEPVLKSLSHITVTGSDGRSRRLAVTGDPREVRAIEAPLASLESGTYRVDWHVISADGHPVSGEFHFSVGRAEAVPVHTSLPPHRDSQLPLLPATLRGLALSALLALCGLLGFTAYASTYSRAQARLVTILSIVAPVFFVVHLGAWILHVSPLGIWNANIVAETLSSEAGISELIRTILVILASWAALLARRHRLAFPFALAAVITSGMIGHPSAIDPVFAIPAKALHLAGVAFWLGGLIWLVSSETEHPTLPESASTVSRVALTAIIVVAITGGVQGFLFLSEWKDLLDSAYGRAMLGKIGGLALLAGFGAYHRYRLMARGKALRASVRREIVVMIATVMLGGILAHIPAPRTQFSTNETKSQGTSR